MSAIRRASGGQPLATAEVVTPVPAADWAEVLATDPSATVYQTREWFEAAVRLSRGDDASRLYVSASGRRLVLPLVRRTPVPGVAIDDSYPGRLGSGGLIAPGGVTADDVRLVLSDRTTSDALCTRFKANHDVAWRWEAGLVPGVTSSPRRVEVLDLDGGFDRVWAQRVSPAARRAVRKAEKSGLTVERDVRGRLVTTAYDLYLAWTAQRARDAGVPVSLALRLARRREPLALVEGVARAVGERCRVWVASLDGEPVATLICLVYGIHASFWRGYGRHEVAGPTRANNLLQRLAIEDACDAGCRYYSMGESGGVASLERFKQSMGATPRPAVEVRIERPAARVARRASHRTGEVALHLAQSALGRVRHPRG